MLAGLVSGMDILMTVIRCTSAYAASRSDRVTHGWSR